MPKTLEKPHNNLCHNSKESIPLLACEEWLRVCLCVLKSLNRESGRALGLRRSLRSSSVRLSGLGSSSSGSETGEVLRLAFLPDKGSTPRGMTDRFRTGFSQP
ncbi:hypothetical protein TNCV_3433911 [Trichonephila clavipes]|nr:hypothetical protein TNCV_3433911 [Trichonephila clavipes]